MTEIPSPFTLHFREETGSTNDDAIELAKSGAPEFTLVWALSQSKGRGRFNRRWLSDRGNLYWSCVVHLDEVTQSIESLNLAAAVAIQRTVARFVPSSARIECKWPNDAVVDDSKISGVLIEGSSDTGWLVVGIGINVQIAPERNDTMIFPPTCISDKAGRLVDVKDVCVALCEEFHSIFCSWKSDGFSGEWRQEYERSLWRVGEKVAVSYDAEKKKLEEGINRGTDDSGFLLLEKPDGRIQRVIAADVLRGRGGIA